MTEELYRILSMLRELPDADLRGYVLNCKRCLSKRAVISDVKLRLERLRRARSKENILKNLSNVRLGTNFARVVEQP